MWPSPSFSGARCACVIMVRGPIRYGMRYSATGQFISTTALHLRRGFCTLVLFINPRRACAARVAVVVLSFCLSGSWHMAPSYANIFMGRLEQRLLKNQSKQPMVWWRFIDDIFLVWTHGETSLQAFVDNLNTSHDTIKFTASWSTKEVAYLDTRVYLDGGKIETDLYVKPTDTHQYLLPSSCHPRHCKESIPYSQALRLKRICSKDETYQTRMREMKQHFLQRGYNEQILESQFQKVAGLTRDETLHHHEREKETRPVLVTTFDPRQPPLGQITKKHHHILHLSDKMRKAVPEPPLIAYRRPFGTYW